MGFFFFAQNCKKKPKLGHISMKSTVIPKQALTSKVNEKTESPEAEAHSSAIRIQNRCLGLLLT